MSQIDLTRRHTWTPSPQNGGRHQIRTGGRLQFGMPGRHHWNLQVEEAVLAEVVRAGADFQRSAVVSRFMGRGAGKSTLFRWIQEIIDSGIPGQHVARLVKEVAAERAARSEDPSADVATAIGARLPIRVTPGEIAGAVQIVATLREIVADFELLIQHAKTDDGRVRNARLLVTANAELRRCLEAAVKLQQAMREVDQVDKLHDAILEEIAKLAPETAEAIYRRIDQIAAQWEV